MPTTPWTPQSLTYGLAHAADPRLSPDGEWVVYGVSRVDPETKKGSSHLWISRRDGSERRQLTTAGNANGRARWSPDGRQIVFVSDREGDQGFFLLSLDGGDPRLLTQHPDGIGEPEWSPDGRYLAYTAVVDPEADEDRPDDAPPLVKVTDRIDYKQDGRGYLGEKRGQTFVLEVETGERRQLTTGRDDHLHPRWSPDGRTLAAFNPVPIFTHTRLELIDVATGALRVVTPETGPIGTWLWSRDGRSVVLTADFDWSFQQELWSVDVASGELRQITHDLQVQPSGSWSVAAAAAHPAWLDDEHILLPGTHRARSGLFVVDVITGDVDEEVSWDAESRGFGTDAAARYVARSQSDLDLTGEIVVTDRQTGETTPITDLNGASLAEAPRGELEQFTIERNGFTIDAWLHKPAGFDPNQRYPLVLDIHGGPASWYGYEFDPLRQLLTTNGFAVVYANPRGSGSYGREFCRASRGDWGGEDFRDLMAVVDKVLERPYLDPARIGIYGYSYGGYLTSWTVGQTGRFKAAVIGAPVTNLRSAFGTSDIGPIWGPHQYDGRPWENPEWFLIHSPISYAHQVTTPCLILHGEADERCHISQSEEFFTVLKTAGVEAEFVRYPNSNHLFPWAGEPAYAEDFLTRILAWFGKYLT